MAAPRPPRAKWPRASPPCANSPDRAPPPAPPAALAERGARLAALGGEESLERLKAEEAAAERAYRDCALRLSKARRAAAKRLAAEVTRTMQLLAMPGGRLEVALEPLETPTGAGLEAVEPPGSAHHGQALAPLARVASGGELSRLSLAVQVLLSGEASVPTLIFDAGDAGIGGGVAGGVGGVVRTPSPHHQAGRVSPIAAHSARAAT